MGLFRRSFWLVFLTAGGILVAGLHLWWSPRLRSLPSAPPFPQLNRVYVSYGGDSIPHYLIWFGLFGFEEKIRNSDVFLIGSSHPMMGLSAARMSERLSEASGHRVKVLNLGVGYGEGAAFASKALFHYGIHKKTVILDLFTTCGDGFSSYAEEIMQSSRIDAYVRVMGSWLSFGRDWALDGFLPWFKINEGMNQDGSGQWHAGIDVERFLSFPVGFTRWDTNDGCFFWYPTWGIVYAENGTEEISRPFVTCRAFGAIPHDGVFFSETGLERLRELELRPIGTLIHYEGGDPNYAKELAVMRGVPFVPIAPDGLTFFDAHHLTGPGKVIATDRLLDGLESLGIRF